jgi:hypothetical protein
MAHTTFRGPNDPVWKGSQPNPTTKGPNSADSKVRHSSTGPEREMRKNLTKTEEAARAAHIRTDTKQHPALKGNTTAG